MSEVEKADMRATNSQAEAKRLEALQRYAILDTPPEPEFDRITAVAARLFGVPMAVITLIDEQRQWFKSRHGVLPTETPRAIAFCAMTIAQPDVLVIKDAAQDPRVRENPLVLGSPRIRFYAGAPVRTPDGYAIGSLAILDERPREFTAQDQDVLISLAAAVMTELELRVARAKTGLAGEPAVFREMDPRLAFALGQLPAALWTTDLSLRYTSSVGAALPQAGLQQNELVGRTVQDALGRDDHPGVIAHKKAALGEGVAYDADWSDRSYRCRVEPLHDAAGAIVGTIGVLLDITESVDLERAMRSSEERLRLFARASQDVGWDWNLVTDEMTWSENLEKVFGYALDRVGPTSGWWTDRIHPEDRHRVTVGLHRAVRGGAKSWADEYRFLRADGRYAEVSDQGFVYAGPDGASLRMIGSMADISARKQMEARLMQADRLAAMGMLAAGVAHEINNPLSYVMTNVSLLRDRVAALRDRARSGDTIAGAELVATLDEIQEIGSETRQGIEAVGQIARDLRIFSRQEDERGPVDVRDVLESTLRIASGAIRTRARVRRRFEAVPAVSASPSRLGQVFLNLLVNAAQAVPEGRLSENEILVEATTDPAGRVAVSISDSGPGMSAEVMGRIFDPFFTTKPAGLGTGLGLFISRSIVRALGGDLVAESTGRGSTFRVILPAQSVVAGGPPRPEGKRRPRLLIVDDDTQLARSLERIMQREFDVAVAATGAQALELLRSDDSFDVVLCDLMMPDVSGIEVYRALRTEGSGVADRIIFMSGASFTPAARDFLAAVPNARIDKPLDVETLRRLLRAKAGLAAS